MCEENNVLDIDFSVTNDAVNWITNSVNPVINSDTLDITAGTPLTYFDRVIGVLDALNDKLRVRLKFKAIVNNIVPNKMDITFSLYDGDVFIEQHVINFENLLLNEEVTYFFDREFNYTGAVDAKIRIQFPYGFHNTMKVEYIKVDSFTFCPENIRSYFIINNYLDDVTSAESTAIVMHEYKIDNVETLTASFFAENITQSAQPTTSSNILKFAVSDIDGLNRIENITSPNTFNPFIELQGLQYSALNYFDGLPVGTISGSDYGEGLQKIGFDKPVILNGELELKKGAFFIDIDYTKNLNIVFDVVVNKDDKDNVYNSPFYFRRYVINWNIETCKKEFCYTDQIAMDGIKVNEGVNGFLSGITDTERNPFVLKCYNSTYRNNADSVETFEIDYGTDIGLAGITYNVLDKPIKITIDYNGSIYTTGYVGSDSFDIDLINSGVLVSEINTEASTTVSGVLNFNKTTPLPINAVISIHSPLSETNYNVSGVCPAPIEASIVEICTGTCEVFGENWETVYINATDLSSYVPTVGDIVYSDSSLFTPYVGSLSLTETRRMRYGDPSTLYVYTFTIDPNGIIGNVEICLRSSDDSIQVVNSDITTCYSCFQINVRYNEGDLNKQVQFISSFAPSGLYGTGFCNVPSGAISVGGDNIYTITEDTTFVFGIDGSQGVGIDSLSTIDVVVINDGNVVSNEVFSRTHVNQNC